MASIKERAAGLGHPQLNDPMFPWLLKLTNNRDRPDHSIRGTTGYFLFETCVGLALARGHVIELLGQRFEYISTPRFT